MRWLTECLCDHDWWTVERHQRTDEELRWEHCRKCDAHRMWRKRSPFEVVRPATSGKGE